MFAGVEQQLVVCGHTHAQSDRVLGGVRIVNAGSVGMPYEGRAGAYWALLGPDVRLRRTDYDVRAAEAELRGGGWPGVDDFLRDSLVREVRRYQHATNGAVHEFAWMARA